MWPARLQTPVRSITVAALAAAVGVRVYADHAVRAGRFPAHAARLGIAERVYNGGLPFHGLGFTLFFKWLSRFAHADAAVLPDYIVGEIISVPAHAREFATAQQLL